MATYGKKKRPLIPSFNSFHDADRSPKLKKIKSSRNRRGSISFTLSSFQLSNQEKPQRLSRYRDDLEEMASRLLDDTGDQDLLFSESDGQAYGRSTNQATLRREMEQQRQGYQMMRSTNNYQQPEQGYRTIASVVPESLDSMSPQAIVPVPTQTRLQQTSYRNTQFSNSRRSSPVKLRSPIPVSVPDITTTDYDAPPLPPKSFRRLINRPVVTRASSGRLGDGPGSSYLDTPRGSLQPSISSPILNSSAASTQTSATHANSEYDHSKYVMDKVAEMLETSRQYDEQNGLLAQSKQKPEKRPSMFFKKGSIKSSISAPYLNYSNMQGHSGVTHRGEDGSLLHGPLIEPRKSILKKPRQMMKKVFSSRQLIRRSSKASSADNMKLLGEEDDSRFVSTASVNEQSDEEHILPNIDEMDEEDMSSLKDIRTNIVTNFHASASQAKLLQLTGGPDETSHQSQRTLHLNLSVPRPTSTSRSRSRTGDAVHEYYKGTYGDGYKAFSLNEAAHGRFPGVVHPLRMNPGPSGWSLNSLPSSSPEGQSTPKAMCKEEETTQTVASDSGSETDYSGLGQSGNISDFYMDGRSLAPNGLIKAGQLDNSDMPSDLDMGTPDEVDQPTILSYQDHGDMDTTDELDHSRVLAGTDMAHSPHRARRQFLDELGGSYTTLTSVFRETTTDLVDPTDRSLRPSRRFEMSGHDRSDAVDLRSRQALTSKSANTDVTAASSARTMLCGILANAGSMTVDQILDKTQAANSRLTYENSAGRASWIYCDDALFGSTKPRRRGQWISQDASSGNNQHEDASMNSMNETDPLQRDDDDYQIGMRQ